MRIQKDELILGHPAVDVRMIMRKLGSYSGGVSLSGGEAVIAEVLGIAGRAAQSLFKELIVNDFVDQCEHSTGLGVYYTLTIKGAALAQASAAPPIHRPVAKKRLHELVERMEQINRDPEFILGIEEAAVFGSYLTAVERLSDLDISYVTYRKIEDGSAFVDAARKHARASGRHFSTFIDELFWPNRQVVLFLKQRSRVYSLAENEGLLKDPSVARKMIFRNRRPVLDWDTP